LAVTENIKEMSKQRGVNTLLVSLLDKLPTELQVTLGYLRLWWVWLIFGLITGVALALWLIPQIGEYEPPSVKECKLVLEDTNNSLHSLHDDVNQSVELLKSQQIILQEAINKCAEFMQLSEDKAKSMNYDVSTVMTLLNNGVTYATDVKNYTTEHLQGRIEAALEYLNRIRDYCLHADRS
jgi:hypothetical protein